MNEVNCFECKKWFPVKETIHLPIEGYYLCHHDAVTYYATKYAALQEAAKKAYRLLDSASKNYASVYELNRGKEELAAQLDEGQPVSGL